MAGPISKLAEALFADQDVAGREGSFEAGGVERIRHRPVEEERTRGTQLPAAGRVTGRYAEVVSFGSGQVRPFFTSPENQNRTRRCTILVLATAAIAWCGGASRLRRADRCVNR